MANLLYLQQLNLSDNQITTIPDCIKHLSNLNNLDLSKNRISNCPEWLQALPNLNTLDLRKNPLPISPEILGPADLKQEPGDIKDIFNLVCNCRTSEEESRIEYWLKLTQSFGGESPVIIIGNKSDEHPLDINRKALRQKYPNICAILETSCQTGQGIEELRATITEEVGKLREVYNLLPLS